MFFIRPFDPTNITAAFGIFVPENRGIRGNMLVENGIRASSRNFLILAVSRSAAESGTHRPNNTVSVYATDERIEHHLALSKIFASWISVRSWTRSHTAATGSHPPSQRVTVTVPYIALREARTNSQA